MEFTPVSYAATFLISLACKLTCDQLGLSSRNKLIIFADGTYLELFNWLDRPPEEDARDEPMKAWAKKEPGLIALALSSMPPETIESHFSARVARLKAEGGDGGLDIAYTAPAAGGRMRKDGVEVKWKVSRPEFSRSINTPDESVFPNGRMDAPFFCYDVTSRNVRVPFEDKEKTTHPCGAVRIAAVEILVPNAQMDAYVKLYSNILGSSLEPFRGQGRAADSVFQVGLPIDSAGASAVRIRSAQNDGDVAWLKTRGAGISQLVLAVTSHQERANTCLGAEGIASTILLEQRE